METVIGEKLIRLFAFGMAAEILQTSTLVVHDISDTEELKDWLHHHFPQLGHLEYCLAIDHEIVTSNTPLTDGEDVAILPPFSGG